MTIDTPTTPELAARAGELLTYDGLSCTNSHAVENILMDVFAVSRDRAKTAIHHAVRAHRGHEPRKHDPAWADLTRTARSAKRRLALDQAAQAAGYASWSSYETAVINGAVQIMAKPYAAE